LEWVNDGLMVIFFFVVGLEIKREVTTGELANPKKAILPIAAAFGGMIVPALLYVLFNVGTAGAPGWGIPMATDIAFTLGIMAMLGRRVPLSLKVFFTALAIVDDLGAVLVIAVFYTADISWMSLGVGGLIFVVLLRLNRAKVYATLPYAILGIGLWIAFLRSGIHPTIAGVLLALTIPTRSPANVQTLLAQSVNLLRGFDVPSEWRFLAGSRRQATIQTLENIVDRMQSPAQRLERDLHPWTTFAILPIFALANAGVTLANDGSVSLLHPVSLGIVLGLVLGKPMGISLLAWLAVRSGLGELPSGVGWRQLLGASCLAGIGFTISLFIAGSAFEEEALQSTAKLAILAASSLAAVLGWALLYKTSRSVVEVGELETAVALHS
jgi:NhaA family Na+:H+ antiporter